MRWTSCLRFLRARSGNVAVIFALSLVPLLLAAGGAIDYLTVGKAKASLQNAIDSATLAGAGDNNSATTAANFFAAQVSGGLIAAATPQFTVNSDNSFTGTVNTPVTVQFMALLGITQINITASATANHSGTRTVCILLVEKNASQSLLMNSGSDIEAPSCEIDVATMGSPAAIFNSSTTLNSAKTCLAGSSVISNGGTHPNLSTGCKVAGDPFAGQLPVPSTSSSSCNGNNYNGGSVTLSPGVYCGWYNFNSAPRVTFQPGLYVIKGGGWNVNGGTWTGSGVTFYFADSSNIQFNSAVTATLSAPASGSYSGILMYEAGGLSKSQFIFNTTSGHTLSGLIYLPSRNLIFNSGVSVTADAVTLVANTLTINSSSTWRVTPPPSKTIAGSSGGGGAYLVR
jgi:Flp pilus assembly protein TadG